MDEQDFSKAAAQSDAEIRPHVRPRYIPLLEAEAGMVIGADINVMNNGILRLRLQAGHTLTEDNLRQLAINQAEFIAIAEEDVRSAEKRVADVAAATERLQQIFSGADLADPTLLALYEQVLAYRTA